jgi:multiple sugar transport system permease protein
VAGSTTFITIILAVLAGYALARLRMKYKGIVMGALLAVSMFPQISIAGPLWRILQHLEWLNSYQGLIAPYVTLTLPLGVWVLASFFRELPGELEDAARIDGCGHLQTLFKIIVPLAAPGVFTAAILVFIYAWNEFFFALLVMTRQEYQTLPVGIALFQGQYTMPWGEIAAASTIATVPLVLLVLLFQRRIVRGLSAGAIKG